MSIVNMSSSRPVPERELEEFEQLAIALSGRLTRLHFEEVPAAITAVRTGRCPRRRARV